MNPQYQKARRHLSRKDEVLKRLIRSVGQCTLKTDPEHFGVLVRSIVSQQISTKAAVAISTRLLAALHGKLTPQAIHKAPDDDLRGAGLSASKLRSLRDLAEKCTDGSIRLKQLPDASDPEVIAELTQVHGIGPWTAEMFLIFSLGRLDVLPVADFGLRAGVRNQYELADLPKKAELEALAEPWKPFRSIGTWYIWRSFGNVPQSE